MRCFTILLIASCLAISAARHTVKRHHTSEHDGDDASESDDNDTEDEDEGETPEEFIKDTVKRHHTSEHDGDDDNESDDNDTEDEDEGETPEERECGQELAPCFELLSPYLIAAQTSETLKNVDFRTQCHNLNEISSCFSAAIKTSACERSISEDDNVQEFLEGLDVIDKLINYICVQKIDDFEQHESCFRDVRLSQGVEECRKTNVNPLKCDATDFIQCTNDAIDAQSACDAGAKEVAADFIREVLSFVPECQGARLLANLRAKLFKLRK